MHLEWRRVHDYLKDSATNPETTMFSRLVSQFLEQIHDRIFEQDFAGIVQKIAFGVHAGVYPESYLDEVKRRDRWNTPRRYEKLEQDREKAVALRQRTPGDYGRGRDRKSRRDEKGTGFPVY